MLAYHLEMAEEKAGLRERKKRELKTELSRSGIKLFTERGFEQTTIDDIVKPLRVSKRTFFRYFETKEDLVFAWYEELTTELAAAFRARPKEERPYDSVCWTLRSLLHYYDSDPKWALAMQRLTRESAVLAAKSLEKRSVWERELSALLQKRLPKSATRQLQANVIVGCAMTAFANGVNAWSNTEGKASLAPFVDRAFAYAKEL